MREERQTLLRWLTAVLTWVFVAAAAPTIAYGAGKPTRIAVKIEGPQSQAVRKRVVAAVPGGVTVIEEMRFVGALARAGLPGGRMAYSLTSKKMRPALLKIVKSAVAADKLDGAVIGRTGAGKGGFELTLLYVQAEGEPPLDTAVPLTGSQAEQLELLKQALAPVLGAAPAAPEPEPEPPPGPATAAAEERPAEEAEPAEEEPADQPAEDQDEDADGDYVPHRPGSEISNLELGFQLSGRFFSYRSPAPGATNLRPYDAFGAPGAYVGADIFPAATSGVPVLRDLGLTATYGHVFGWRSHTADDRVQFSTTWNQLWAGLVYRFRAGDADDLPVVIDLRSRFGYYNFSLDADNAEAELVADEVASVRYLLLGGGLDARIPIGAHFAILPGFGAYGALDGGDTYDRFTDPGMVVLNAELKIAVVLGLGFELRAGAEYLGALSWFDSAPTDPYVADGADDHCLALRFGLAHLY